MALVGRASAAQPETQAPMEAFLPPLQITTSPTAYHPSLSQPALGRHHLRQETNAVALHAWDLCGGCLVTDSPTAPLIGGLTRGLLYCPCFRDTWKEESGFEMACYFRPPPGTTCLMAKTGPQTMSCAGESFLQSSPLDNSLRRPRTYTHLNPWSAKTFSPIPVSSIV